MSLRMHGPARDKNEKHLVDVLSVNGWDVLRKLDVDLLAFCPKCGGVEIIEVKNPEECWTYTPIQEGHIERGHRMHTLTSPDDMRAFVAAHVCNELPPHRSTVGQAGTREAALKAKRAKAKE